MTKHNDWIGSVAWLDLTVPNAERVSAFYSAVVGWKARRVDMGGYDDFNMMQLASGAPQAGVCHARGVNKGLPAQWLAYVRVKSVVVAARRCRKLGGRVLREPTKMGVMGRFCVIRDPAGAVLALFEPPKPRASPKPRKR